MNTQLLILFAVTSILVSGASAECVRGHEKGLKVRWTAFKTPQKIGVSGFLEDLKGEGPREAESWQKLVLGQTLTLGTGEKSVNSKDKVRDAKIAEFFFGHMKGKGGIVAKVLAIDEKAKRLTLSVAMNGKTLETVSMAYTLEGKTLEAKGYVDILDFAAGKSLAAINKACLEKHEGKTWSDVTIEFKAEFKDCG